MAVEILEHGCMRNQLSRNLYLTAEVVCRPLSQALRRHRAVSLHAATGTTLPPQSQGRSVLRREISSLGGAFVLSQPLVSPTPIGARNRKAYHFELVNCQRVPN